MRAQGSAEPSYLALPLSPMGSSMPSSTLAPWRGSKKGLGNLCLTCAVPWGPSGQPFTQLHLHATHQAVNVLGGAVARLLQQICECPGEGHRNTGPSGSAYIPLPIPSQVSLFPHTTSSGEKGQPPHWSHLGAEKAPGKR